MRMIELPVKEGLLEDNIKVWPEKIGFITNNLEPTGSIKKGECLVFVEVKVWNVLLSSDKVRQMAEDAKMP